jgi:hypothetical protein
MCVCVCVCVCVCISPRVKQEAPRMNTPLQNDKVDDSDSDVELLSVSEVVKGWGGDQREKAKERRSPVVFKNKRGGGLTEVRACTQSINVLCIRLSHPTFARIHLHTHARRESL